MIRRASRGFTLVEVMVALAVVAVALPALVFSLSSQVDATAYLRDKAVARMVASNKLEELRLVSRARQQLFNGDTSGVADFGGREWFWWVHTEATELDGFVRMEVGVSETEETRDNALYTLVAFMNADLGEGVAAGG